MSSSTLTEFIRLVFVARNLANFLRFFGRKIPCAASINWTTQRAFVLSVARPKYI